MSATGPRRLPAKSALLTTAIAFILVLTVSPYITRGAGSAEAFELLLLPRAIMGCLAGAALACCGVVLQAVLRNDLASPFTLGIASGATLGAAFAVRFELGLILFGLPWLHSTVGFALAGALATTFAIYAVAQREETLSPTLLLAGVGLSLLVNAFVTALFLIDNAPRYNTLLMWTLGNLQQIGASGFYIAAPAVALGSLGLFYIARDLNIIALDEDSARALGVDAQRVRKWALLATGVITAGVVAAVGPIGFIGLIVPHAVRRLTGPDIRIVLPCSALLGGAFLGSCDLIARLVIYPLELPIGVVTSIIGSPIFIAMLLRRRGR